ncbi:MAG TPA: bifunctional diguanylate cyclase/phosphodiesterase [Allosphingosinicella sp.]|nr:bifunctional diguanylate cyclase/phosphodiesterase [Allosphingosinicella sp.]
MAAIVLFVGTCARAMATLSDLGRTDPIAAVAVLLNVALVLFAWRRHKAAAKAAEEWQAAEEKAHRFATRDQLTNLFVRSSLLEAGREAVRNALEAHRPAAVIVLNLDRFKHVNEVYGHRAGDALLRGVSEIIVTTVRDAALCARIGADEFCLLCPITEAAEKEITRLAERLLQLLSRPIEIDTVPIHISASVGMSRLAAGGDFETLLRQANIAMTEAKKAGGNRAVWFNASMESALKARTEVESGLRRGIPLGEFVPYYQPQVDLRTGRICGFEALARWNHPAGGVVGPDVFIPVAEETGLIADLFDSICGQALVDAKEWDPELTLAVNISPSQLKDPWLAQRILKLLTATAFPAERLEVEITESSLFESLALAQAIVASLKNQGVKLALDDFGTGYSSLANLRALPFDRIKIDRSFVQAMQTDRESLAIATAIAKMGESLGVPVTAEGVTGEEVRQQLLSIGCDKGQGWLFGKPLAQPEVRLLLAAHGQLAAAAPAVAHADAFPAGDRKRSATGG